MSKHWSQLLLLAECFVLTALHFRDTTAIILSNVA